MTTNLEKAAIRKPWLKRLEKYLHCSLEAPNKKVPTSFSSPDGSTSVVLRVATKLDHGILYWFSLDANHRTFLQNRKLKRGFVAFGCGAPKTLLVIPFRQFSKWLDDLNPRKNGWNVQIYPKDHNTFALHLKGVLPPVDLTKYLLK